MAWRGVACRSVKRCIILYVYVYGVVVDEGKVVRTDLLVNREYGVRI